MKSKNDGEYVSIEKAILADVCLGVPLAKLVFDIPAHMESGDLSVGEPPKTYLFRGEYLSLMKGLYQKGQGDVGDAVAALVEMAEKACGTDLFSVADKPRSRFSNDPKDYQSLAKYAWPENGETRNERPYVIRDGEINPECYSDDFDYVRLVQFSETVVLLALAAYLTGQQSYAKAAARLCRAWFLDVATRQNPHFSLSQVVPGSSKIRWAGIIEARFLVYVTEAMRLLDACNAFEKSELAGIKRWFGELLDWMEQSEQGMAAQKAQNNIGFWYDLQRMVYAEFCDRGEETLRIIHGSIIPRMDQEMLEDGSLPRELSRAYPQDYVAFSLVAMALISRGGEQAGVPLWGHEKSDGRNFQAAHDWLLATTGAGHLLAKSAQRETEALEPWQDLGQALDTGVKLRAAYRTAKASRAKLARLESEHSNLLSAQAQLESEHSYLVSVHSTLETDHSRLEAKHSMLKSENSKLKKNHKRIVSSRSWRLTRPLRFTGQSVRQLAVGKREFASARRIKHRINQWLPPRIKEWIKHRLDLPSPQPGGGKAPADRPAAVPEVDPLKVLQAHAPANEAQLKRTYADSELATMPDTFVLYRIIGNDLYPRHAKGQSRDNVRFILENEPELEGCEKRWVVNRIFDAGERQAIIELLEQHGQSYLEIPFEPEAFAQIGWDYSTYPEPGFLSSTAFYKLSSLSQERVLTAAYRKKNLYLMNNNGARNAALEDGLARAKWVLPWDGNCFVTPSAWEQVRSAVQSRPHLPYFAVPMQRITDNAELLRDNFIPNPVEEPQLLFRCDARERLGENHPYGRRPKVELFWRLGIPGKWDNWKDDPWEQPRAQPSPDAGAWGVAGWVARLASGKAHLEASTTESFKNRGRERQKAIRAAINHVTREISARPDPIGLTSYRLEAIEALRAEHQEQGESGSQAELLRALLKNAAEALQRQPESPVDKSEPGPSGDLQDYYHPVPYWWPNPDTKDGLPYVRRDGERVPGTRMYEPDSHRYDRTRVQRLFDDTTTLSLAAYMTGDQRYATHAVRWLERWFIDPATRMNPHLTYSQVRWGRNKNRGAQSGVIEMKDLYYALDAIRLLEHLGALSDDMMEALRGWCREYLDWLLTSEQGIKEAQAQNNHGTYYDLQVAALAAFLDDTDTLYATLTRAEERIPLQISPEGVQHEEMTRTNTAHDCCFTLMGWLNLMNLASRFDGTMIQRVSEPDHPLRKAVEWLMAYEGAPWPYAQIDEFDYKRFFPIKFLSRSLGLAYAGAEDNELSMPVVFSPHDGVQVYWLLSVVFSSVEARPGDASLSPNGEFLARIKTASFGSVLGSGKPRGVGKYKDKTTGGSLPLVGGAKAKLFSGSPSVGGDDDAEQPQHLPKFEKNSSSNSPEIFFFASWCSLQSDNILSGMAFHDDSVIIGNDGFCQWLDERKGSPIHKALREGRFSCVYRHVNELFAWCDDMAQETIYYFLDGDRWAFSNSFLGLARELKNRKISLSIDKGALSSFEVGNKSLFGGQLLSHQTPISEIRILPRNHCLKVALGAGDGARLSVERFVDRPVISRVFKDTYTEGLIDFIAKWKGRFAALAKKEVFDHYKIGLSGGYDSRVTFSLALQGISGYTERYKVHSDPRKIEDLRPASALRDLYQIKDNFRPSNPIQLNAEQAYDIWKLGCVGVYLPVYVPRRLKPAGNVNVHGGHFRAHAYSSLSVKDRLHVMEKQLKKKGALNSEFRENFLDSFGEIDVDVDDPRAMHEHYLNFRSRFHYGRNWYKSLADVMMTPLISSELKELSDACIASGGSMEQVTHDLMYLLDPRLPYMPFDREEKNFTREVSERSRVKGHALAGRVPSSECHVFGNGLVSGSVGESALNACGSIAELRKGLSELMAEEFQAEGESVVDIGLVDAASFREMCEIVKSGTHVEQHRTLLSLWVTRITLAKLANI